MRRGQWDEIGDMLDPMGVADVSDVIRALLSDPKAVAECVGLAVRPWEVTAEQRQYYARLIGGKKTVAR